MNTRIPCRGAAHQAACATVQFAVLALLVCPVGLSAQFFERNVHTVAAPYAGRYEARMSGSAESEADKIRLDIGGSAEIFTISDSGASRGNFAREENRMSLGADFFTWSRLRSEPNFKFPVEDIDYFFGVHASLRLDRLSGRTPLLSEIRFRVAHISAHAVDGDPAIVDTSWSPFVYSREFLDVLVATDGPRLGRFIGLSGGSLRPYVGALWTFHSIPALRGKTTPYAGIDLEMPFGDLPIGLRAGYELRINTEGAVAIGEHQARLGLKIGRVGTNGLLLETAYYSGSSQYGQLRGAREAYFSYGFTIEF